MKLRISYLLGLAFAAGCATAPVEEQTSYIQISKSKNAEEVSFVPWHGSVCFEKGQLEGCGKSKWQIGGADKGYMVLECAGDKSKSIEIPLITLKPQKLSELQLGYLFSNCTSSGKTNVKARLKEYDTETNPPYIAVLPSNAKDLEEAASQGLELWSDHAKKFAETYEADLKKQAQDKEENLKKAVLAKLQRETESNIKTEEIKKNWSTKAYSGNTFFFSKKDKLLVSAFVGRMNWLDATANCRGQGLRLPSIDEAEALSSNGLCQVVTNNCFMPLWTGTSRHNDQNAQRNMLVENGAWGLLNGQGFPSRLTDELGVICVK